MRPRHNSTLRSPNAIDPAVEGANRQHASHGSAGKLLVDLPMPIQEGSHRAAEQIM